MNLKGHIFALEKEIQELLETLDSQEKLEKFRIDFLGRKGKVTQLSKGLGTLSREERPEAGKAINRMKGWVEEALKNRQQAIKARLQREKVAGERIDITLPGRRTPLGRRGSWEHR